MSADRRWRLLAYADADGTLAGTFDVPEFFTLTVDSYVGSDHAENYLGEYEISAQNVRYLTHYLGWSLPALATFRVERVCG